VVRSFLWTHHNGLGMIMQVEVNYLSGMLYALVSIILGVLFTLMNGKIQNHDATVISFMSSLAGFFILFIFIPK
jgi:uncharacterized metal-binding protein